VVSNTRYDYRIDAECEKWRQLRNGYLDGVRWRDKQKNVGAMNCWSPLLGSELRNMFRFISVFLPRPVVSISLGSVFVKDLCKADSATISSPCRRKCEALSSMRAFEESACRALLKQVCDDSDQRIKWGVGVKTPHLNEFDMLLPAQ